MKKYICAIVIQVVLLVCAGMSVASAQPLPDGEEAAAALSAAPASPEPFALEQAAASSAPQESFASEQAAPAPIPAPEAFPAALGNAKCYGCHTNPDLKPVTDRGAGLAIVIPGREYERSVHGGMSCVGCHAPSAVEADFNVVPHVMDREALPSCLNCHDKAFAHVTGELAKSRHFEKQGAKIACVDCHDPHRQQRIEPQDSYLASVADSNRACVNCHTSKIRYQELTGKAVYTQDLSHEFLPKRDRHFASVRCIDCHTPADKGAGPEPHRILPKEQSLRDCARCHTDDDSFFVERVMSFTDVQQGAGSFVGKGFFDDAELIRKMREANIDITAQAPIVTRVVNPEEVRADFADKYVPGFGQTAAWDGTANVFLLLVFAGLLGHGAIRFAAARKSGAAHALDTAPDTAPDVSPDTNPDTSPGTPGERVYPLGIRVLHWTNALLFIALLATGFSIHYASAALSLPLEWSVNTHNAAGVLLTANFLAFLLYALLTGEIRQYLPAPSGLFSRLAAMLGYYLFGIFTGAEKPFHTTARARMNPVQQLTYLFVYCLGMPVLLCSGLLLLVPELAAILLPETGTRLLATAHYILAVGYLAFLMLHLYMTTTGSRVSSLVKGMITGRHYE